MVPQPGQQWVNIHARPTLERPPPRGASATPLPSPFSSLTQAPPELNCYSQLAAPSFINEPTPISQCAGSPHPPCPEACRDLWFLSPIDCPARSQSSDYNYQNLSRVKLVSQSELEVGRTKNETLVDRFSKQLHYKWL